MGWYWYQWTDTAVAMETCGWLGLFGPGCHNLCPRRLYDAADCVMWRQLISCVITSLGVHVYNYDSTKSRQPRSCVKVEVAVLGSPYLIVRTVRVDIKQHWTRTWLVAFRSEAVANICGVCCYSHSDKCLITWTVLLCHAVDNCAVRGLVTARDIDDFSRASFFTLTPTSVQNMCSRLLNGIMVWCTSQSPQSLIRHVIFASHADSNTALISPGHQSILSSTLGLFCTAGPRPSVCVCVCQSVCLSLCWGGGRGSLGNRSLI